MQPLILGPFAVARDGALQPRQPAEPPALRFCWRGRRCEAAVAADGVRLAAIAGRIPSTAEAGADRASAFEMVAALPRSLPPGWRLQLLPDHRIRLEAAADTAPAPTATSLIAAMVRFALAMDPYPGPAGRSLGGTVGQAERLAGIDPVGVADLLPVRLVDHRVAGAAAIDPAGDAPEVGAGLHHQPAIGQHILR